MGSSRFTDRLLFLAYPDATTATGIADLGWDLRDDYDLSGLPLLPQHIHASLWHVGDDFFPPSDQLIQALVKRAKGVKMPSFCVSFDHVESFSGGALVLRGQDGVVGLEMLHLQLASVLGLARRRSASATFTPHVTLLRDERLLPPRPIQPVEWNVTEFVLVHSLLGKSTHRPLWRFPLG